MAAKFDPLKSKISNTSLAKFLSEPISHDLKSVPGIGPRTISKLKEKGIDSTFALLGKFLQSKGTTQEKCDAFWDFLDSCSTPGGAHRSGCTQALLELLTCRFPEFIDASELATIPEEMDTM